MYNVIMHNVLRTAGLGLVLLVVGREFIPRDNTIHMEHRVTVPVPIQLTTAPIRIGPPKILPGRQKSDMSEEAGYSAIGRVYHNGNPACSVTVVGPRAKDGSYYAVFSAHCTRGADSGWTIDVGPLKTHPVQVVARWKSADLCLLKIDTKEELSYVLIAATAPKKGSEVWHKGYGRDKPGNVERGKVLNPGSASHYQTMTTKLSSGDSGSGLFLKGTCDLVGVNHSTINGVDAASSHGEVVAFFSWIHPDRGLDKPPYIRYDSNTKPKPPPIKEKCP